MVARKYAGPLQPGKRSAYVPGLRKNKGYRRRTPGRLKGGSTSYTRSMKSSDKLKAFGEVKLNPFRNVDNVAPIRMNPIGAPAPVYGLRYVVGNALTQYPNYNALQGMNFPQGVGISDRIGNYMYLKKVNLTMEINMNQVGETNAGPRRFRVIIFKARRYANPTGITQDPDKGLLLDTGGEAFGVNSSTKQMLDFIHQLTNKRDYQIVKDHSFILQNPVGNPSAGVDPFISTSGQYKSTKTIRCSLPLWRKTKFESVFDLPTDVNYNYGIYVQSVNVGSSSAIPDDWNMSIRGVTSANDV